MAAKNLIILSFLFSLTPLAQSQQEHPNARWLNKQAITQLAMLGTVFAVDGYTSQQTPWNWKGREWNPLLGSNAGPGRTAGLCALAFAGSTGSSYLLKRHNRLRWVTTGAITAVEIAVITRNIRFNQMAAQRCPNNPLCTLR